MVGAWCFGCCQAHQGLPVGFPLLWYSVLFTVEYLSSLYLLFIFWFICSRRRCKPNIYVSWSTSDLRVRLAHCETGLSPLIKYIYWPFQGGASFVDHLCYFCLVFVMFSRASVYWCLYWCLVVTWWERAWLWFVIYNCEVVTFPLVSWVRCDTWLYRFLIFALFLTWSSSTDLQWQVLELRIVKMISSIKTCIGIHSISSTSSDRYWTSG